MFYKIFLVILFSSVFLRGQNTPPKGFHTTKVGECTPKNTCIQLFLKVEIDPILSQYTAHEFENYMAKTIKKMNLATDINGHLKLWPVFYKDGKFCIDSWGNKEFKLSEEQTSVLIHAFDHIKTTIPGKQKGIDQSCIAILYLMIENGQLSSLRNVNFSFAEG